MPPALFNREFQPNMCTGTTYTHTSKDLMLMWQPAKIHDLNTYIFKVHTLYVYYMFINKVCCISTYINRLVHL